MGKEVVTTKFKIFKPSSDVFEVIVNPEKIGNYWFSSSSERWGQDKTITLKYDEYAAEVMITVLEIEKIGKSHFLGVRKMKKRWLPSC
ncbi:hypothetical protein [Peribacillus muralis]|uniref:hypothetical protein n=1 Tax=Peribacillus muralis TaxID=264697 RepID=UPI003D087582